MSVPLSICTELFWALSMQNIIYTLRAIEEIRLGIATTIKKFRTFCAPMSTFVQEHYYPISSHKGILLAILRTITIVSTYFTA